MFKTLTLVSIAVACCSAGTFAQKTSPSAYQSFVKHILSDQTPLANKSAVLKERLIGSGAWDYNGSSYDQVDTFNYQYSGARGSALSINDDENSYSYGDNSTAGLFEGLEGPSMSTLSYDSAYMALPLGGMYARSAKTYDAAGYLK